MEVPMPKKMFMVWSVNENETLSARLYAAENQLGAAEQWAAEQDRYDGPTGTRILHSGPATVYVRDVQSDDVGRYVVEGKMVPAYQAKFTPAPKAEG